MREALASLTARGRLMAAAGITAIACSVVLGQYSLLRVGILLLVLPAFAVLVVNLSRYRVTLERTVSPTRVRAGQTALVTLHVRNEGFNPPGTVLIEDEIGYVLGSRPRFLMRRTPRGSVQQHQYRVATDARGRHLVGPALLRVSDPLGLVEVQRRFRTVSSLVVLPVVIPLSGPPSSTWTAGGSARTRSTSVGEADDVTVRAYRRGDDVRRVHWRSTARTGELMVRHEEQPHHSRATLLLDVRRAAHRGVGAASSFEAAVRITASVLAHLSATGHDVHLLAGEVDRMVPADDLIGLEDALEQLAVLTTDERRTTIQVPAASDRVGTLVAVLGACTPEDRALLDAAARTGRHPRALAIDVEAWRPGQPGTSTPPPALERWQVAAVTPRSALDDLWRGLK